MNTLASKNGLCLDRLRIDEAEDFSTLITSYKGAIADSNCKIAFAEVKAQQDVYVDAIHNESTKDYSAAMRIALKRVIDNYWLVCAQIELALKKKDVSVQSAAKAVAAVLRRYAKTMDKRVTSLKSSTVSNSKLAFEEVAEQIELCGAMDFYADMMSGLSEYKTYSDYRDAVKKKKVNNTALKASLLDSVNLLISCVNVAQKIGDKHADLAKTITIACTKYAAIVKARTTRNAKKDAAADKQQAAES